MQIWRVIETILENTAPLLVSKTLIIPLKHRNFLKCIEELSIYHIIIILHTFT